MRVDVIAVGSGRALDLGRAGDVDVLLVHSPAEELALMKDGSGVNRRRVAVNDFVVVGPAADPAEIRGLGDAAAVFRALGRGQAPFVSRGDRSGTHVKELELWRLARVEPAGAWYRDVGQGMGATLTMASELGAYCLTDRGTWGSMRDRLSLTVLFEGGAALRNPYHAIAVSPQRHPQVHYQQAMLLIAWLTSVEGQKLIGSLERAGRPLFEPAAGDDRDEERP